MRDSTKRPRPRPRATNEAWARVAEELGGELARGRGREPTSIRLDHHGWPVRLSVEFVQTGSVVIPFTRCTIEVRCRRDLRFKVTPRGKLSGLVSWLGLGGIALRNPRLDRLLEARTNDETKVRSLLSDPAVSEPLTTGPRLRLRLERPGWLRRRRLGREGRSLVVEGEGRIQDPQHLKSMIALATATLDRLLGMGVIESAPGPAGHPSSARRERGVRRSGGR